MRTVIISVILGLTIGILVIWFGVYNVAANDEHFSTTSRLIEIVRERSISVRSEGIKVPDLDNNELLKEGAEHYADMCTGCHLGPGIEETELHAGLYPKPPVFSERDYKNTPSAQFWVIKNGLKMTGMPAWSPAHTDEQIWGMVAFINKSKTISAEKYIKLIKPTGEGHDHNRQSNEMHNEPQDDGHNHEH